MLEKPISFLRKLVTFRKCIKQTGPTDRKHKCFLQNTNVFCQSKHICVLNQNTFVFCHTPDNCYHSCTYCHANNIKYYTKDDLHPHWPPPLPLSAPCWRHCHRCYGCCVVATIAAIAIAAATTTAAAVFAPTSTVSAAIATAFWLIYVCPCAACASATVAFTRACRWWLLMPLPLSSRPQTAAP